MTTSVLYINNKISPKVTTVEEDSKFITYESSNFSRTPCQASKRFEKRILDKVLEHTNASPSKLKISNTAKRPSKELTLGKIEDATEKCVTNESSTFATYVTEFSKLKTKTQQEADGKIESLSTNLSLNNAVIDQIAEESTVLSKQESSSIKWEDRTSKVQETPELNVSFEATAFPKINLPSFNIITELITTVKKVESATFKKSLEQDVTTHLKSPLDIHGNEMHPVRLQLATKKTANKIQETSSIELKNETLAIDQKEAYSDKENLLRNSVVLDKHSQNHPKQINFFEKLSCDEMKGKVEFHTAKKQEIFSKRDRNAIKSPELWHVKWKQTEPLRFKQTQSVTPPKKRLFSQTLFDDNPILNTSENEIPCDQIKKQCEFTMPDKEIPPNTKNKGLWIIQPSEERAAKLIKTECQQLKYTMPKKIESSPKQNSNGGASFFKNINSSTDACLITESSDMKQDIPTLSKRILSCAAVLPDDEFAAPNKKKVCTKNRSNTETGADRITEPDQELIFANKCWQLSEAIPRQNSYVKQFCPISEQIHLIETIDNENSYNSVDVCTGTVDVLSKSKPTDMNMQPSISPHLAISDNIEDKDQSYLSKDLEKTEMESFRNSSISNEVPLIPKQVTLTKENSALQSEDKDLAHNLENIQSENKDLVHNPKNIQSEDKDLVHNLKNIQSENKDLVHNLENIQSENKHLVCNQKNIQSVSKELLLSARITFLLQLKEYQRMMKNVIKNGKCVTTIQDRRTCSETANLVQDKIDLFYENIFEIEKDLKKPKQNKMQIIKQIPNRVSTPRRFSSLYLITQHLKETKNDIPEIQVYKHLNCLKLTNEYKNFVEDIEENFFYIKSLQATIKCDLELFRERIEMCSLKITEEALLNRNESRADMLKLNKQLRCQVNSEIVYLNMLKGISIDMFDNVQECSVEFETVRNQFINFFHKDYSISSTM
ncbi:hypothetical protein CDAR_409991 [Caerostris darwini]|uniref:Uncharacterized protein n=1 Tax=Caerostris darwini TaxID=1538125 RepID=A0AAV4VX02_9ARAC|nr:hypothetical protein CDAR_409991 [Caerostris darwini]